jgi:protein O-GlcNAc transferase
LDKNQEQLQIAIGLQQTGQFSAAEQRYLALLQQDPDNHEILSLLGVIAGQTGRHQHAVERFTHALALNPNCAAYYHNLGEAYRQQGNLIDSEKCLIQAVALEAEMIPALQSLVAVRESLLAQAIKSNLHERALTLRQQIGKTYNNLGNAWLSQLHTENAEACYRKSIDYLPQYALALSNLGNVLQMTGRIGEAELLCRRALNIDTTLAAAYTNLGNALFEQGRQTEALSAYEAALHLDSNQKEARHNVSSGKLFMLLYDPNLSAQDILKEHQAWGKQHDYPVHPFHGISQEQNKHLRIAYFSPDFRTHAMMHFVEPLLAQHDPQAVEIFCYAEVPSPDTVTQRIQSLSDHWCWSHQLSDQELSARIRADKIDILIDLAGHTRGGRLVALANKPAPILATWLGYPNTTGLPSMDYHIVDDIIAPEDFADVHYSENLIRLSDGFMAYQPPAHAPETAPLLYYKNGYLTFGCFNAYCKINPTVVAAWAAILKAVPNSRLLLKNKFFGDPLMRARFEGLCSAFQLPLAQLNLQPASADWLHQYANVDIALDPFPYTGGTTTCESLWMGVPVVTLLGERYTSRLSASILRQLKLEEWITQSPDEYIATALKFAQDPEALAKLREQLREQMRNSTLCDYSSFARKMEHAYRQMWKNWLHRNAS